MPSVNIYLRERALSSGEKSVYLQMIIKRKVHKKKLLTIHPKFWDKRNKRVKTSLRGYVKMNTIISDELKDAEDYLLDCQQKGLEPSAEQFFDGLTARMPISKALEKQAEMYYKTDRFRTAQRFTTTVNKVHKDIQVGKLTIAWLNSFNEHMMTLGNNPNTRGKELGNIQTVINKLLREQVIDKDPFNGFTMPKAKSYKVKLTLD